MGQSPWFGNRSRVNRGANDGDSYLAKTDTERREARTRPHTATVRGAPLSDPPKFALDALDPWNEQIARFKPSSRQLANNLVIAPGSPSDIRSAYNVVRTEALKRLRQNRWNTVAITSPSRFSGNTLTALNLAISMARDMGQSVLLVELDL